jgi:hypothetical protein
MGKKGAIKLKLPMKPAKVELDAHHRVLQKIRPPGEIEHRALNNLLTSHLFKKGKKSIPRFLA